MGTKGVFAVLTGMFASILVLLFLMDRKKRPSIERLRRAYDGLVDDEE